MPLLEIRIPLMMVFPFSYFWIWYHDADFASNYYVKDFSRFTVLNDLLLLFDLRELKSRNQISEITRWNVLSFRKEFYISYKSD